ncbi:MAG: hypothetical protein AUJ98_07830 [Bacteroidetes bacterium CG2_30_33_31]|nr:MAG: hypothetical protein AUJ98_07830 [Bacteroidetes bacterium CG2_30_33_31]
MEIIFKYSAFWILPIFGLALSISLLLYYQNKREEFPRIINAILGINRFLVLFLLGLFLLSPMVKTKVKELKKITILLAVDNSKSIILNPDSAFYLSKFTDDIFQLQDNLSKKYNIAAFMFGNQVHHLDSLNYKESSTNISLMINELYNQFRHKNLGALIIATDGIYNNGENPDYLSKNFKIPIYTIALGDTNIRKDIGIDRIAINKVAFLGDKFPIEVETVSKKCAGNIAEAQLFIDSKLLETKKFSINSNYQHDVIRFSPKADIQGIRKIVIKIKTIDGEYNIKNNISTVFVEVLNSRQKILIAYNSPHPDISAIKRSLLKSDNYQVQLLPFSRVNSLQDFNLAIFYNMPENRQEGEKINNLLSKSSCPYLLIAGIQTDINAFNSLNTGLKIKASKNITNEILPSLNEDFELFGVSKEFQNLMQELPPLNGLFGSILVSDDIEIAIYQKIGNVKTNFPLLAIRNSARLKNGVLMGEGIWRWPLFDFQNNNTTDNFDEFIGKFVKLLCLQEKREKLNVDYKNVYKESDNVEFNATVYNSSFELVKSAEIRMLITNLNSKIEYQYIFNNSGDASYSLNVGKLIPGEYSFKASTKIENFTNSKNGKFFVQAENIENLNLESNHHLLNQMSSSSGGKFYYPKDISKIVDDLEKRNDLVNVEYKYLRYSDIIDLKWIMFVFILLLSLEYMIRKYLGSY